MPRLTVAAAALLILTAGAATAAPPPDARALHESMLTLDTHLDTPANFSRPGWDIMDRHAVSDDSQVDYPRMVEGGLDGGFFAVYTPQGPRSPEGKRASRDAALIRAMEIHEMVARHGDKYALALTPDDAKRIAGQGKRVVFMSMENGAPFEGDLSLMQTFYKLGVRMMSPVHFLNNDLGDSSTDPKGPEWKGLSPEGKAFIAEANRLGILIDVSHSSDDVLDQAIALSKTPIILSHSGCKAIYNHPRNIDDDRLRALAKAGGVIQINAYNAYMIAIPPNPERQKAQQALNAKYGPRRAQTPDQAKAFAAELAAIDARYPIPHATFEDFMKHLMHALQVAGVDHVGIGPDMDGGGGLVGFEDISSYPKVTARLLAAGYSAADIQKVWSGNALRVLAAAEAGRTAG
jgi:membrane dipeptidase